MGFLRSLRFLLANHSDDRQQDLYAACAWFGGIGGREKFIGNLIEWRVGWRMIAHAYENHQIFACFVFMRHRLRYLDGRGDLDRSV